MDLTGALHQLLAGDGRGHDSAVGCDDANDLIRHSAIPPIHRESEPTKVGSLGVRLELGDVTGRDLLSPFPVDADEGQAPVVGLGWTFLQAAVEMCIRDRVMTATVIFWAETRMTKLMISSCTKVGVPRMTVM